ncbi:hypothetical protein BC629DRAFT_1530421 [Irpex lacteus]|nr:hypothetical protein BC629DRAFT_1530421 [Irpex lacteus]
MFILSLVCSCVFLSSRSCSSQAHRDIHLLTGKFTFSHRSCSSLSYLCVHNSKSRRSWSIVTYNDRYIPPLKASIPPPLIDHSSSFQLPSANTPPDLVYLPFVTLSTVQDTLAVVLSISDVEVLYLQAIIYSVVSAFKFLVTPPHQALFPMHMHGPSKYPTLRSEY